MLFRIFKGLNILIDSRYYSYFGVVFFKYYYYYCIIF